MPSRWLATNPPPASPCLHTQVCRLRWTLMHSGPLNPLHVSAWLRRPTGGRRIPVVSCSQTCSMFLGSACLMQGQCDHSHRRLI